MLLALVVILWAWIVDYVCGDLCVAVMNASFVGRRRDKRQSSAGLLQS